MLKIKNSLIEYLAEKYSGGNVKKELISRMKQFTDWELEEDDLTIFEEPNSLEITIKEAAQDYLNDSEILDLLKVAIFLGATLYIKPATKKSLSITFHWDRI